MQLRQKSLEVADFLDVVAQPGWDDTRTSERLSLTDG